MYRNLLYFLLVLVADCSPKQENTQGIYTRYSSSEYSKAYDTLIVGAVDPVSRTCLVQRKTGYIRIYNGIEQTKQWKSENMLTILDPGTHQLNDPKTGRPIRFGKGELLFGTAVYKHER